MHFNIREKNQNDTYFKTEGVHFITYIGKWYIIVVCVCMIYSNNIYTWDVTDIYQEKMPVEKKWEKGIQ